MFCLIDYSFDSIFSHPLWLIGLDMLTGWLGDQTDSRPLVDCLEFSLSISPMFIFPCSGNAPSRVLETIAQKHLMQ